MARAHSAIEDVIRTRVHEHPDSVWLKFRDETYTWQEVLANVNRAANGLLDLGVRPGERVAIMMGNRPEFLWIHLGIVFIGALSVPVNISQRGNTLRHILSDSDSVVIVFEENLRDAVVSVREELPSLRATVVAGGGEGNGADVTIERLLGHSDAEPEVELEEPVGGAGIMYTSGTTGPPKGIVATGYDTSPMNLMVRSTGVQPGETMYTSLPLFHANALLVSALGSMVIDAKLALGERFSASRLFDECRKHEAVEFNTLGGMVSMLLKQEPRPDDRDHPVRVVLDAGCPPAAWEELQRRFGVRIVEWFGMADSPGILLNDVGKVGAMGRPVAGVDFRVVDGDDNPLPPGEVGELVFRHPWGHLTHYHKLPEATDEAYRGGWFHSQDLAVEDEEGFLLLQGPQEGVHPPQGREYLRLGDRVGTGAAPRRAAGRGAPRTVRPRRGRREGGGGAGTGRHAHARGVARLLRGQDGPLRRAPVRGVRREPAQDRHPPQPVRRPARARHHRRYVGPRGSWLRGGPGMRRVTHVGRERR